MNNRCFPQTPASPAAQDNLSSIDKGRVRSDGTMRFPRSHRLLTAADYSRVFSNSRRLSDRYWTILVHHSEHETPRLGLAIAKKRARRAVDRNRLKRLVRESFRQRSVSLCGRHLVVMNRDDAVKADNASLQRSLDTLLGRL